MAALTRTLDDVNISQNFWGAGGMFSNGGRPSFAAIQRWETITFCSSYCNAAGDCACAATSYSRHWADQQSPSSISTALILMRIGSVMTARTAAFPVFLEAG